MLNFRTKEGRAASRPTNYLGHKFQRPWIIGLFVLAGGLWLVRGGDPAKFSRMFGQRGEVQVALADGNFKDNAVEKPAAVVRPGEVKAVGPRPENPVEGKRLFHNVDPKLFTTLEDDAVHRFEEQKSFFTLLKTLEGADERDIDLASSGRRNFRQLFEQTDDYRGEIVTVAGIVRRIVPQPANENPQGIKKFYEVWIEPTGGRLPIAIDCLEMPRDYPVGGNSAQYVEATGFYYKRLGYPGEPDARTKKEVFRSAPLVLAKTLRWTPQAAPQEQIAQAGDAAMADIPGLPKGLPVKWMMPLLGLGIVLMIVLAVWSFRLSRSSVLDRNGPIVGRARRAAEAAQAPQNLNKLKIDP
ncbi:MAG: hypothetical protein K8U03_02165 [Planctomycetia bacterium]|nr:hypothetical protein [Planctomycetia bacterium]